MCKIKTGWYLWNDNKELFYVYLIRNNFAYYASYYKTKYQKNFKDKVETFKKHFKYIANQNEYNTMKKITVKNFKKEFSKVDKRKLTSRLKEQYELVKDIIEFYGEDKTISESIDNFLNELNEHLVELEPERTETKAKIKSKPKKKIKPKEEKKVEQKPKAKPKKDNATKKKSKSKKTAKKTVIINNKRYWKTKKTADYGNADFRKKELISKKEYDEASVLLNVAPVSDWFKNSKGDFFTILDNGKYYIVPHSENKNVVEKTNAIEVNSVDLQVSIIKSFYLLLDKKVSRKRVLNLYKKIEKSALEKTIRKFGKHAKLIETISAILAKEYNENKSNILITVPKKDKEKLKQIAYSEKQKTSVRLLKRQINVIGKSKTKKDKLIAQANKLLKSPQFANDEYFEKLLQVTTALEQKNSKIYETKLAGLLGTIKKKDNLQGLGTTELISSSELDNMDFNIYEFSGKWAKIIGKPSNPFIMMIHGQAKGGKSSFALQFAKYLSQNKNQKVAYFSAEEGFNHTFVDKLKRFDAINDNLFISENMPKQLQGIDILFIDSINYADIKIEHLQEIKEKYPNLSIVYVMHETKGGVFKGGSEWEHFPDIIIKVDAGTAQTERSRFNEYGKMRVF